MKFSITNVVALAACLFASKADAFSLPKTSSSKSLLTAVSPRQNNVDESNDRRAFLLGSGAAAAFLTFGTTLPAFAAAVDYKAVSADIAKLITDTPSKGPTFVRLAWHSSGTYDKMTKTGGSGGGTIRFSEELAHGGNAGLAVTAIEWMEPIHKAHPGLSYADLYTLGGVTAIKSLGGPTIPWSSGRVDEIDPSAITPNGRLPNADVGAPGADPSDAQHLRDIFYRMGFNDEEIVCLSGAHALGRCHTTASGYDGPWTPTPTVFNNSYFSILQNLKWDEKKWDGPVQYVNTPGGQLMMLPSDLVLLQDKKFLTYVTAYAKDATKFNTDFTKAFQKLEELGTSGLTATEWA